MGTVKLRFLQDINDPKNPIKKGQILDVKYDGHQQFILSKVAEYVDVKIAGKTVKEQIPIINASKQIATLQIMGKHKFSIEDNNGKIVFPLTETKTPWPSSAYYRKQITKALTKNCELIKPKAEDITNTLCAKANEKIKRLEKKGAFSQHLSDENQEILDKITKVTIIRSVDGNVYNIHLDGEIITLTDKELYVGPFQFCISFLNRFLKRIVITQDEWIENFIPYLLSEEITDTEDEKIESELDNVCRKFLNHIKNKKVFNWEDTEKRTAYINAIYLNTDTNIVLICSDLIQDFFEKFKIGNTYKTSVREFNGFLRLKKGLVKTGRSRQRVGDNERKSFWRFDAEKLGISKDNIVKEETEENTTYKIMPVRD